MIKKALPTGPQILVPNRSYRASEDFIQPDPGHGYDDGQVFLANDSRLLATYFSEPLTNYAVGFVDPTVEEEIEFWAPKVPVGGRRFEWKKADNDEEYLSEAFDDQRAIGSDFKRVEYTQTDVTDKTLNKGLTIIVDLDNVAGQGWENQKIAKLMRRLKRNEIRRAIAAIDAAAVNTNKTWDSSADPDQDVASQLIAAANIIGVRPSRVGYGDSAWNLRRTSFRAQNNAGADASARMSPEELRAYLMVDQVFVSRSRYTSAAATKTEQTGSLVYAFDAQSDVDTEDPSQIKRFVSPVEGGGDFRVYQQQISAKLVALTVEHYSKIVITFSSGIRKITAS